MANWAKSLATELAGYGITVNNVLPGFTATDRMASILKDRAKKQGKTEEEIRNHIESEIPIGRAGQPEEIAAAAAFLASPAASFITGINLPVDGGRMKSL
jgi:3-oxoacyl-[acyl-carrier protein] reductase